MKNIVLHFLLFITLLSLILLSFYFFGKTIWYPYYERAFIEKDIQPIPKHQCQPCEPCHLLHVGPLKPIIIEKEKECPTCPKCPKPEQLTSQQKMKRYLADSNFVFYPKNLTIIGLKHEKLLEVWTNYNGKYLHIITYPFTSFSGILGPKFKEGDRQIPEGIYKISYLNSKSKFHLAMRLNYPNEFDKKMAKKEKRTKLGADIMIHGSNRTIGCVPIGDKNIEQLYFLVEKIGIQNVKVILSPVDFRRTEVKIKNDKHPWLKDLYKNIKKEMKPFTSE
jgi:murein L,D-transpeptidase YafK